VGGEPVPAWDADDLAARDCFGCGSAQRRPVCVRPDGLEVARCSECGAAYLPRVPSAAQLERFYADYARTKRYLQAGSGRRGLGLGRLLRRIFGSTPVSPFGEILVRTGGVAGKTVVEVGPGGQGGLLHEVRRLGGVAIAVEVDVEAAGRLREAGLRVCAALNELAGRADIVVCSMVLEHVADPSGLLGQMAQACRPGARLLVSVPNAGQAAALGPAWIGFRVDLEHLNYFDAGVLARRLSAAGFLPECWWESAQPVLPAYQPLADRRAFFAAARTNSGRSTFAPLDPMAAGSFQLTMLACRAQGEGDDGAL
jgi:SAM-dependent methyltransferase